MSQIQGEEQGDRQGRLKDVIDKIAANQLTSIMQELDDVAKDITSAASGSGEA